jgi:hypothetical protein
MRIFPSTRSVTRLTIYTSEGCQQLLKDIHFIPQIDCLKSMLGRLCTKLGRLSLNLFSYNHLDGWTLLARS